MMGFFNEDFYKELDKNFEEEEETADEFDFDDEETFVDDSYYVDNMNLEINKNNKEKFKNIMDNASTKYDSYWDLNNPIIRFILIVLFVIIAVGLLYYIIGWISIF